MRTLRPTDRTPLLICGLLLLCAAGRVGAAGGESGPAAETPAGLLLLTGEEAALEPAPVLGSRVDLRVTGTVARARVTQIFLNPGREWLEALYVFPLAEGAAVDGLRLTVGERVIEGRIEDRRDAEKAYEEAAAEGRKATLLEQGQANLFTTRVANVGPGEWVTVEIELQQEVRWVDGSFELRFPTVVAPHYEPSIDESPDEPPLSLPRPAPPLAGGDEPVNPIGFQVDLEAGFPLARLASPSHAIEVTEHPGDRWTVELSGHTVPADSDFVLRWSPAAGGEPHAVAYAHTFDGEPYVLLMVMPPAPSAAAVRLPRETVLVIDTSGSMEGSRMKQARAALATALGRLEPQDRFNVIRFSDRPGLLFPTAVPADPATVAKAGNWVSALEAGGGTEMLAALKAALFDGRESDAVRQVVFITDGEVGREADLLRYIARHLGRSRLFTVGIGSAPNAHFMERAARLGRGTFTYVADSTDVEVTMAAFLARLEEPVMTDLRVDWDGLAAESFPDPIPDLYLGEPVVVAARLPGAAAEVRVAGWRGDQHWEATVPLAGAADSPAVPRLWARRKVASLVDAAATDGTGADPETVRDEVVQLGLRHRLVTAYTSLVAIDEAPSAPPGTVPAGRWVPVNPPRDSFSSFSADSGVAELIVVTGVAPLLDETSSCTGSTATRLEVERLPTARDPWVLLLQTPGVLTDRLRGGGLAAPVLGGPATPPSQTTWSFDGVVIADPGPVSGPGPAAYDFDPLEEIRAEWGGSDVSATTPGLRVDLVTRSGSNEWALDADLRWTGDELAGADASPGAAGTDRTVSQRTAGGDGGGPLLVDRLWLWAGARSSEIDRRTTGGGLHEAAADSATAKLDALLGGSASATVLVRRGETEDHGLGADPRRAPEATWDAAGTSELGKVEGVWVASSSLYLSAIVDQAESRRDAVPTGGTAAEAAIDGAGVARRSSFLLDGERLSRHAGADASYFFDAGGASHELGLGTGRRRLDERSLLAAPGRGLVVSAGTAFGLPEPVAVAAAWRDGAAAVRTEGTELWLQDTLTADRWIIQAGVRFDRQELSTRPAAVAASPFAPDLLPAVDLNGGDEVVAWEAALPRLGITRAFDSGRRSLLRASFGRFAAPLAADLVARVHPAAPARALYLFSDADGDLAVGEDELGGLALWVPLGFDLLAPAAQPGRLQPGLGPELTDEAILAVEHEFTWHLAGALTLALRRRSDLLEERPLVRDVETGEVFAATAGDWLAAGEATGTLPDGSAYSVPWFDLRPGLSPTGGTLTVNGDRRQDYRGLGLSFTRHFDDRWQGRGQLTYSEARWRLGPDFRRFDDPTDAAGGGDVQGERVAEPTAGPFTPGVFLDSRWSLHLDGMVELPRGFHLAAMLDARQGYPLPYSRRIYRPAAGPAELQLTGAVDTFRAPDLLTLDARADKDFALGGTVVTLSLEVFNLFDQRTVLRRQLDLGLASAAAAEETLPPRTLRVGVRLRWR